MRQDGCVLIDSQRHVHEGNERSSKVRICDLVASLATLRLSDHDPAVAQAGEMVRHVRARQLQLAREHGRVARTIEQRHQDPGTRRIRHGTA